jgi:hypothetical protein
MERHLSECYNIDAPDILNGRSEMQNHVMWVPVTKTWRVLGLQMQETASRYGR